MMPRKEQIEQRARELYHKEQSEELREINPEVEELAESGYLHNARIDLMRSEGHQFLSYLEEQAHSLGYVLKKDSADELEKQTKPYDFEVDIDELLRSGCMLVGGKGQAKTNLAKIIAHKLMEMGITVRVFDISKAWLRSSIPYFMEIQNNIVIKGGFYDSVVFDLSKLLPRQTKKFISDHIALTWEKQVNINEANRKWIVFVFEEVQDLIPQGRLRSNEAQQVLRLLTTGRNYKLGYIAVTQRPALTDTSVFELTWQKYFARMNGQNDLAKVASYIGAKAYDLEKLKLGEFMYDKGNETKLIATKEFRSKTEPQRLPTFPIAINDTTEKQPKPNTLDTLIGLTQIGALVIFVLGIISAIAQM